MPAETLVILNPASRGGRREGFSGLEKRLAERLGPLEVAPTAGVGDATRIAREAARAGVRRLVVAGGDGTFCEAANGVLGAGLGSEVELGVLPLGTGCDLARALGMPRDPLEAAGALAGGKPRPVDAGRLRTRDAEGRERTAWFVNEVSTGVSGDVVARVKAGPRWLPGRAAFLWATLRSLVAYAPAQLRVRVDGVCAFEGAAAIACAANGGWFGGGMHVAPEARFDDGLLDLIIVRGLPGVRLLPKLRLLYTGTHLSDPAALALRGREIEIESLAGPVPLEADGELQPGLPARIDVTPGALTVLTPGP